MIKINLLAPGRRRAAGPAPGTLLAIGSIVAIVVILGLVGVYLGSRVASLHGQIKATDKKLEQLRPIAIQVQELDAKVRSLEVRQAELKRLLGMQLPASQSLEAIKNVIPRDVWLVNVTTQQQGHNVLFDGYTFTYKAVARFMVALRDSERFRNVDLTSTQKDKVGDREVVKFQITTELIGGPAKSGAAPWRPETPAQGDPSRRHAASLVGVSQ
jgi:Tfp pilus assembly protein PilN